MAYQYAKLGLAALMAVAPALAAPIAQQVTVVCVDQTGKTLECPPGVGSTPPASTPDVQAQAVHPASSAAPTSAAAASPTKAASSAAHTTSAAAANPSGGTSTGGKKGLVYTKNSAALAAATQIASASKGEITWMYDWEGYPFINGQGSNSYEVNGVEFVPMLHSKDSMFTSAWTSANPAPQGKGAKHALFINEPDNAQWATDIDTAANLWKNTFKPNAGSALLGGAGVSSAPTGPAWLSSFYKKYPECKPDFQPMHAYMDSNDLSSFKTAVQNVIAVVGESMPIWVTEFGLKAVRDGGSFSAAERADFIKQASEWMDTVPQIQRYSPYQVAADGSADSITAGGTIAQAYTS